MTTRHRDAEAVSRLYERYVTTQVAPVGDPARGSRLKSPYLRRFIKRHVPADRSTRIFELGCGSGELLGHLAQLGYGSVGGVDGSSEQVRAAHEAGRSEVRLGSALEALQPMEKATLDVVIAFDVLEHLALGELLEVVDEVRRVLRSGGKFIVHVPNGAALLGPVVFFGDLTHRTCFTTRSLRQLFSACNFTSVAFEEDNPVVHGPASLARWLVWRVLRTLALVGHVAESGDLDRAAVLSQGILAIAVR